MVEELISKKELLDSTGISYGQLYRWKRKKLIPEEWFIKKSAFTGQETYFPKEKILERVNKIITLKEDISLDDLAETLSEKPLELKSEINELIKRNIVTQDSANIYIDKYGSSNDLTFKDMLSIYILNYLIEKNNISIVEIFSIIDEFKGYYDVSKDESYEIVYFRKLGIGFTLIISTKEKFYISNDVNIVERINITEFIRVLKEKLV